MAHSIKTGIRRQDALFAISYELPHRAKRPPKILQSSLLTIYPNMGTYAPLPAKDAAGYDDGGKRGGGARALYVVCRSRECCAPGA